MANIRTEIISDFKTIKVISDSATSDTDYPVLEIYINAILAYTTVVGGTAVIGSSTYNTTSGVTDLLFTPTLTVNGTEYIFDITPTTLGLTSEYLPDGVYTFKLLDVTETTDIYNHEVAYYQKNCCMATKLNKAYGTSSLSEIKQAEDEVIKISSLLQSTVASCAISDVVNAIRKFKVITLMCENCGCS